MEDNHMTALNPIMLYQVPLFWLNEIQGINGLVQDCSNSIANTLELLQPWAKPVMYGLASVIPIV